jgi:hypothetical protein
MAPAELDVILRAKPLNLPAAVREWYLLAANWNQGGLNVWIRPGVLAACGGMVWVLGDTGGITHWGVRVADAGIADPPVFELDEDDEVAFPSFSRFVAAMIVNDVLFDYESEEPVKLTRDSIRTDMTCFVSSRYGDFFADDPLESATVVIFAYPGDGPVYGKSRTPEGRLLLQRLHLKSV